MLTVTLGMRDCLTPAFRMFLMMYHGVFRNLRYQQKYLQNHNVHYSQRKTGKKGLHQSTFYKLIKVHCPHIKKFRVNSGNCSMCSKMATNQATFNTFKPDLKNVVGLNTVKLKFTFFILRLTMGNLTRKYQKVTTILTPVYNLLVLIHSIFLY